MVWETTPMESLKTLHAMEAMMQAMTSFAWSAPPSLMSSAQGWVLDWELTFERVKGRTFVTLALTPVPSLSESG